MNKLNVFVIDLNSIWLKKDQDDILKRTTDFKLDENDEKKPEDDNFQVSSEEGDADDEDKNDEDEDEDDDDEEEEIEEERDAEDEEDIDKKRETDNEDEEDINNEIREAEDEDEDEDDEDDEGSSTRVDADGEPSDSEDKKIPLGVRDELVKSYLKNTFKDFNEKEKITNKNLNNSKNSEHRNTNKKNSPILEDDEVEVKTATTTTYAR